MAIKTVENLPETLALPSPPMVAREPIVWARGMVGRLVESYRKLFASVMELARQDEGEVTGIDTAAIGLKSNVVTHGLPSTPTDIQVTLKDPTDTAVRFGGVWTRAIGATTFTLDVTVTTAGAGGSTVKAAWRARY